MQYVTPHWCQEYTLTWGLCIVHTRVWRNDSHSPMHHMEYTVYNCDHLWLSKVVCTHFAFNKQSLRSFILSNKENLSHLYSLLKYIQGVYFCSHTQSHFSLFSHYKITWEKCQSCSVAPLSPAIIFISLSSQWPLKATLLLQPELLVGITHLLWYF